MRANSTGLPEYPLPDSTKRSPENLRAQEITLKPCYWIIGGRERQRENIHGFAMNLLARESDVERRSVGVARTHDPHRRICQGSGKIDLRQRIGHRPLTIDPAPGTLPTSFLTWIPNASSEVRIRAISPISHPDRKPRGQGAGCELRKPDPFPSSVIG